METVAPYKRACIVLSCTKLRDRLGSQAFSAKWANYHCLLSTIVKTPLRRPCPRSNQKIDDELLIYNWMNKYHAQASNTSPIIQESGKGSKYVISAILARFCVSLHISINWISISLPFQETYSKTCNASIFIPSFP